MSTATSKKIFNYKSDWFQFFDSVLKNEPEEEKYSRIKIKANIVESNFSSFNQFAEKHKKKIEVIPAKEDDFFNVKIKHVDNVYHLYVDTINPRFWLIHNIEYQKDIDPLIKELFHNSYLQDKIYIPNRMMENYWKNYSKNSLGVSLTFEQLLNEESSNKNFSNMEREINNYTLRLWPKRPNTMENFIEKFREIDLPINYKYLNYVFKNEAGEILMKENIYRDGKFTINKGSDFRKHIDFIEKIKEDYNELIKKIEKHRLNWRKGEGNLFVIKYNRSVNPNSIYKILKNNQNIFKILIFPLYKEENFHLFDCMDLHTAGRFKLQIFKDKMYINLNADSCGNLILRLFSNLEAHLSPDLQLKIDNQENEII